MLFLVLVQLVQLVSTVSYLRKDSLVHPPSKPAGGGHAPKVFANRQKIQKKKKKKVDWE